nr:transposase [Deltaproteobacteria bacterium]
MTPMEFMGRLSAVVAPPRTPLVRYHGVLAPNSPWESRRGSAPAGRRGVRRRSREDGRRASGRRREAGGADEAGAHRPGAAALAGRGASTR